MTGDPASVYRSFLLDLWHCDADQLPERAAAVVTPEFVIRRRGGESESRGPQAVVDMIAPSFAMFGDVEVTLDVGPLVDGDQVAARWTFNGTYRGGVPGTTAPAGTRVSFSGHDIVRLEGDRVAEYWVAADGDHMIEQLSG